MNESNYNTLRKAGMALVFLMVMAGIATPISAGQSELYAKLAYADQKIEQAYESCGWEANPAAIESAYRTLKEARAIVHKPPRKRKDYEEALAMRLMDQSMSYSDLAARDGREAFPECPRKIEYHVTY